MAPDDPLAQKRVIASEDMAGKSLILPNRYQTQFRNWMGPYFREDNVHYLGTLPRPSFLQRKGGFFYART